MANGLLSPVEKQTQSVFGMVPMEERLSLLPRYSKTQGLIAPQFIYELAKAVSTPIVAMRGEYVSPEETLNVPLSGFAGSALGAAPKGALLSGIPKEKAGLLNPNQAAMAEIRKIQSERNPTDLSWVNNPVSAEPSRVTNAKPLDQILKEAQDANVKLDVYEKNGIVNLSRIVVPKEQRKSGIGSQIMKDLAAYADANNAKITLSPSTDFGATSLSRLKDFYKKFGFVENKGKNKDFSISETMYRDSQK